jgi:hypothetical protein
MKKLLFILIIFCVCKTYGQATISGTYLIGNEQVSVSADEMSYWLIYETTDNSDRLKYEENTPENEQIWTVWRSGKHQGTIVFKSDYSSGTYTDYNSMVESPVKKLR